MIFAVLLTHKKYDANLSTTHILHCLWAPPVMKYLFKAQVCRGQAWKRMKNNSNSTKSGLLLNVFLCYCGDYSSLQGGGGGFCRNVSCQTNRIKQLTKYGRRVEFSFLPSPILKFKEQKMTLSDFKGFTSHFSINHTKILKWNLWYVGTKKPMQTTLVWHLQNKPVLLSPAADARSSEDTLTCSSPHGTLCGGFS